MLSQWREGMFLISHTGELGHAVAEDFVIDAKYDDKDKWQG